MLLIFCMGFFVSCKNDGIPADVLAPDKMQEVYWDYLRADIYAREFISKDYSKNDTLENIKLQQQVFLLHRVSREQFYRSYDYYLSHRELLQAILDTMLVRQKPENRIKLDLKEDVFQKIRSRFFYYPDTSSFSITKQNEQSL